ncbi:MAG: Gfo/Idh/MocA family oxidoreductase [Phycisphaerae bacterium]|nr:Gfo/Idh/MocA family oxidoreductase [Phycisphaerae bacterium]NIP51247.1 Gfo/Idh/MocA family oxidoreductase [Phycisphaerae bacterium]NIS50453.1 Gfo/Idh/MocA family oxidoreductase [Phycisphaerae bacterium]NIU08188.1 Gfo/Idh/MocA family oxidoreductase [Phycisphaerae bacterium]NIU54959.1 Gfo/Idh/MocA family oxidoreductase [Phycisphaerae bacterium]
MSENTRKNTSRREFLKNTGRIAATSAVMAGIVPRIYAGENNTIKVALIGCGGRGTGAASNALSVRNGPMKIVALADVFESRLARSYKSLKNRHSNKVDIPKDRQFLGFDGYKKAMDCLDKGDVAIFATPPAFRWVHFGYAIKKGLHVFMEKPVTVDGPTTRKLFKLADESVKKNLKVGVGLMIRHCRGRQELKRRIDDGEIGDIMMMRAYRMGGRACAVGPKPDGISELLYQVQKFHSFLWASAGMYSDFYIHQIDECSWMKGSWPIEAHATGGRHYRGNAVDQNFDNYSVEYTYEDGTKFFYHGRAISGCKGGFDSYVHGTKGVGVVSTRGHHPGRVRTYKGYNMTNDNLIWKVPQPEPSPYQLEWDDLIDAIRKDKPYNEAKRGAEASLVNSMGRMAAHTGQVITYDDILNCKHEFAPDVDKLTMDSAAPLQAGLDGKYPVPQPGKLKDREY